MGGGWLKPKMYSVGKIKGEKKGRRVWRLLRLGGDVYVYFVSCRGTEGISLFFATGENDLCDEKMRMF